MTTVCDDELYFKAQIEETLAAVSHCVARSPELSLLDGMLVACLRSPCCVVVRNSDGARLPVRMYINASPNPFGRVSVSVGGPSIDDSAFRAPVTGLDGKADQGMVDSLFAYMISPDHTW